MSTLSYTAVGFLAGTVGLVGGIVVGAHGQRYARTELCAVKLPAYKDQNPVTKQMPDAAFKLVDTDPDGRCVYQGPNGITMTSNLESVPLDGAIKAHLERARGSGSAASAPAPAGQ